MVRAEYTVSTLLSTLEHFPVYPLVLFVCLFLLWATSSFLFTPLGIWSLTIFCLMNMVSKWFVCNQHDLHVEQNWLSLANNPYTGERYLAWFSWVRRTNSILREGGTTWGSSRIYSNGTVHRYTLKKRWICNEKVIRSSISFHSCWFKKITVFLVLVCPNIFTTIISPLSPP